MLKLIRLALNLFAIEDDHGIARGQVAVGTMIEAAAYMKDFHGTSEMEFSRGLAEMTNKGTNTAHFGVINGGFIYSEKADLTELHRRVNVHMKERVAQ